MSTKKLSSERYFHLDFDPIDRTSGSVFPWMNPEMSTICDTGDPTAQPHLNLRQVLETWRSSRVQVGSGIKFLLRFVSGSSCFLMVSSAIDVDTQVKSDWHQKKQDSPGDVSWTVTHGPMSHGSGRGDYKNQTAWSFTVSWIQFSFCNIFILWMFSSPDYSCTRRVVHEVSLKQSLRRDLQR